MCYWMSVLRVWFLINSTVGLPYSAHDNKHALYTLLVFPEISTLSWVLITHLIPLSVVLLQFCRSEEAFFKPYCSFWCVDYAYILSQLCQIPFDNKCQYFQCKRFMNIMEYHRLQNWYLVSRRSWHFHWYATSNQQGLSSLIFFSAI